MPFEKACKGTMFFNTFARLLKKIASLSMNFWQYPLESLQELIRRRAPRIRQIRHFQSPVLGREVDVDIYLPPDYNTGGGPYPLLIINDGQDLPRMNFAKILERMYRKNQLPYIVVAGIYASSDRIREYGTARQADYKGRGDKAGTYAKFVVEEFLPWMKNKFRLLDSRHERAIAGFSLGGLSALDIAWANPGIFNTVGVFSGALWWRWSAVRPEAPDADRIMHDIVRTAKAWNPHQNFWFQVGTLDEEEDRNNNGVIDAIDDTVDMMAALRLKGVEEEHLRYILVPDGTHDPSTWGYAMPDFLRWTFVPNLGQ
jgi:iron(III)-enterobactin esterase